MRNPIAGSRPGVERVTSHAKRAIIRMASAVALCFTCGALPVSAQTAQPLASSASQSQRAISFSQQAADVNGVRLNYVTGGQGPVVFLLHGHLKTSYAWRKVMPALANSGYTVVAPDLRGLGQSSRPANGYDTRTAGEDLYQLARHLGHERVLLVGHDVGGWVAYAMAAAHPEAVTKLVIVDVPLPGVGLEKLMDVGNGGAWHFGFNMTPDLPEALVAGRERLFIEFHERQHGFVPDAVSAADVDEYVRQYAAPGAMRAAFAYYRALPESARQNRAFLVQGKLTMPALAVGADKAVGEGTLRDLQSVAQNARGVVIADCGHFVPEERPAELTKHLLAFFGAPDRAVTQ